LKNQFKTSFHVASMDTPSKRLAWTDSMNGARSAMKARADSTVARAGIACSIADTRSTPVGTAGGAAAATAIAGAPLTIAGTKPAADRAENSPAYHFAKAQLSKGFAGAIFARQLRTVKPCAES
jgi:hypothetical protein